MPPKKKTQSVQTKLNFRPVPPPSSSPKTLFTVESPSPLRPHAAILQMQPNSTMTSASKVAMNLAMLSKEADVHGATTTVTATKATVSTSNHTDLAQQQDKDRVLHERSLSTTQDPLPPCPPSHTLSAASAAGAPYDSTTTLLPDVSSHEKPSLAATTQTSASIAKDMEYPFLSASSSTTPSSTLATYHIPKYIKTVVHIDDSDEESSDTSKSVEGGSISDESSHLNNSIVLSSLQINDSLQKRTKGSKDFSSEYERSDYREKIANHLFKRTVVNGTVYEYIPTSSTSTLFPPSPESDDKNPSNHSTAEQRPGSHQPSSSSAVMLGKRKAEDDHSTEEALGTSSAKESSRIKSLTPGSKFLPLELDSDSEQADSRDGTKDSSLPATPELSSESRPSVSASQSSHSSVTSASSSSAHTTSTTISAKKTEHSLLDMMATPRGTRPMPRTAPPRDPKTNAGYESALKAIDLTNDNASISSPSMPNSSATAANNRNGASGSSIHSPINLSRSDSNRSDDGFYSSSSSLDLRIAPRENSLSQELSPPRRLTKQGSLLSSHSASGGGGRTLPPSLTGGYRSMHAAPSMKPSIHGVAQPPKPIMSGIAASFLNPRKPAPSIFESAAAAARGDRSKGNNSLGGQGKDDESQGRMVVSGGFLLSSEQQYILSEVVDKGRSVFFTGSAGTGKSVLLREIITRLQRKYGRSYTVMDDSFAESTNPVAVTASTGIAACNIGGCTLHSFAGVGLGQESLPVLMKKLQKNRRAVMRWRGTRVLIIDEISMIEAAYLDKLEAVARDIRRSQLPWGGIQVILTGDFFQLPPVSKGDVKFSFEAQCWKNSIHRTIQLQQVFRQKDPVFAKVLNEIRVGKLTPESIRIFSGLSRELKAEDGIRPTELFPLRAQVDEANNRMLAALSGKTMTYIARDRGPLAEKMEANCIAPTQLQLKVNAQVMLLRNQDGGEGGLVNGTLGVVIGFVTRPADNGPSPMMGGSIGGDKLASNALSQLNKPGEELPLVKFRLENGQFREMVIGREEWRIELPTGELQGARVQIPLGLAWSLSIHKSQGQTLPKVRVDLARVFEKGQAYVALSRATTLEGLQVLNFRPAKVMAHPKVVEFYNSLQVIGQQKQDDSTEGHEKKA